MSTTNSRTTSRYARRLSQESIAGGGKRKDVAAATGRSQSTVSSDVTERYHPAAYDLFKKLLEDPETTGRAFAERCVEAVELHEIRNAPKEQLVERGLFLARLENRKDSYEDDASFVGPIEWSEALRDVSTVSVELALIVEVLWVDHGVDLRNLYGRHLALLA